MRGLRATYCMHMLAVCRKACDDGSVSGNSKLQIFVNFSFFRRPAYAEFSRISTLLGHKKVTNLCLLFRGFLLLASSSTAHCTGATTKTTYVHTLKPLCFIVLVVQAFKTTATLSIWSALLPNCLKRNCILIDGLSGLTCVHHMACALGPTTTETTELLLVCFGRFRRSDVYPATHLSDGRPLPPPCSSARRPSPF